MAFEQVREVLDRARRIHADLASFYLAAEQCAEKQKVKLVLEYLRLHEQVLGDRLEAFESSADRNVMDTWLKYTPPDSARETIRAIELRGDMDVSEVLEAALQLDDVLVSLYRQAADMTPIEEARDVFLALCEECRREREKMVLAVNGFA
jgi:SepF-like predicted cell division protein (DUF552 family)